MNKRNFLWLLLIGSIIFLIILVINAETSTHLLLLDFFNSITGILLIVALSLVSISLLSFIISKRRLNTLKEGNGAKSNLLDSSSSLTSITNQAGGGGPLLPVEFDDTGPGDLLSLESLKEELDRLKSILGEDIYSPDGEDKKLMVMPISVIKRIDMLFTDEDFKKQVRNDLRGLSETTMHEVLDRYEKILEEED